MINNSNKRISANKIVFIICIIIFVLYNILYFESGDDISSMILLGADYKTFTLGFGEYFRLITSGFCHFSLIHLIANMISLLSLGSFIENIYGTKKYIAYLLCGILMGSLTSGALNKNIIESGISSALFTFLIIYLLYLFFYHNAIPLNFLSIIFISIGINFLPNVSWLGHLGGAIAGLILFFIDYYNKLQNRISNFIFKLLLIFTIVFLSFKYYSSKDSILNYRGTDEKYVEFTRNYAPFLYEHYENKIYNYYVKEGK